MKNIEIQKPTIFPANISAGITLANKYTFPPYGFSIFPGQVLSSDEVEQHRLSLAKQLKVNRDDMIFQKQVHTDGIKVVSEGAEITKSDGMISNQSGIVLNVTVADCCGILIFDKATKSIAALHSGWRGTSLNMAGKGVKMMQKTYNSNSEDLLVWLSPCAGKESYEVEWDVAQHFEQYAVKKDETKFLLDIREPIKDQLLNAGVPECQIETSTECTIRNSLYHSYRRDKSESGRMSVFIKIED